MGITTPLALRWERAQQIDRSAIQDMGQGWFYVPSSKGPAGYAVSLEFDADGKLSSASCTCPDFEKPANGTGMPSLHGVRVCKHVLAASLKAKDARPQPALSEPPRNGHAQPVSVRAEPQDVKPADIRPSVLPTAGKPVWDAECEEWVLTDSNGTHYCSSTPGECVLQFDEALHYMAEHARKGDHNLADLGQQVGARLCEAAQEVPQANSQPTTGVGNENRRQALSRARGIANQARPPLGPAYRLHGVGTGDVLDYSDKSMFLAVVSVTREGLVAQGVSLEEPWAAVREIRMAADMLRTRLQNGWVTKVPAPRR